MAMQLDGDIRSLMGDVTANISSLGLPACTLPIAGELCDEISETQRTIAIMELLVNGDGNAWGHALMRSARTRIYFLERALREKALPFHMAASRTEPLFDAIAADDMESARGIAELSPEEWMSADEYEDDFHYANFIHHHLLDRLTPDLSKQMLKEFATSLEGASSPRLDICKAIVDGSSKDFYTAFDDLLAEKEKENRKEREAFFEETPALAANQWVFVEGLALIRIAEGLGWKPGEGYIFCPDLARLPIAEPFPEDGYPK